MRTCISRVITLITHLLAYVVSTLVIRWCNSHIVRVTVTDTIHKFVLHKDDSTGTYVLYVPKQWVVYSHSDSVIIKGGDNNDSKSNSIR